MALGKLPFKYTYILAIAGSQNKPVTEGVYCVEPAIAKAMNFNLEGPFLNTSVDIRRSRKCYILFSYHVSVLNQNGGTPLTPSARISALNIVGDLLRKVGVRYVIKFIVPTCYHFHYRRSSQYY